ncbi:glycoside hydrolase [Brachybacterium endophyticum]|uniref:Glycoside hydrolase n=1 Tax=Brachybacterium endophyticum TaxID=2182385 RepID=A0A2U2RN63_9MICO|nr:glycoside hydrolase family 43 protein [Brachybacterium endophyticum]PWH07286.1 glycoside hydrolase [Brachybacterium endophyticum]
MTGGSSVGGPSVGGSSAGTPSTGHAAEAATPACPVPLPDPDVVRTEDGWIVYGTGPRTGGGRAVPAAISTDLHRWESIGEVLEALPEEKGESYWAPEVCLREGGWWMYYSVGHGDRGHHLRVARADGPRGPFRDQGVDLTPGELFAIDASPFRAADGSWWLFFARDVLDAERVGTHLAVAPLLGPTELGAITPVLAPDADWQVFARDRPMYGGRHDWHTLEGAHVLERDGVLFLSYSGGSWQGEGYRTAWAWAHHPTGPWHRPPAGEDILLATDAEQGLIGPGHNSFTTDAAGRDVIAFHAWDSGHTGRYLHLRELEVDPSGPSMRVLPVT